MAKICTVCGADVAQAKRVKDAKGRYYCQPCYEARRAAQASAAPKQPIAHAPPAASADGPVHSGSVRTSSVEHDSIDLADEVATPPPPRRHKPGTCRSCGAPLAPAAVLCTQCGTNQQTGQKLNTQVNAGSFLSDAEPEAPRGGTKIGPLVVLAIALIALLAIGVFVPAATWLIALVVGLAGLAISTGGWCWALWRASGRSGGLFVLGFLIGIVGLGMVIYRAVVEFGEMKKPFAVWVLGMVVYASAMVVAIVGGVLHLPHG